MESQKNERLVPRQEPMEPEPRREDGPRYRLLVPHIIDGQTLNAGTEIGAGTDHPFDSLPSNQMEGVNDEGKAEVNKVHQRLYGRDAPWHDENHPFHRMRHDAAEAKKREEEERKSEPVSHQQALERGHREYRGEPVRPQHSPPPTTRSGDTSLGMGPATPNQDLEDPKVQTRTEKPLSEQLPQAGSGPPKK